MSVMLCFCCQFDIKISLSQWLNDLECVMGYSACLQGLTGLMTGNDHGSTLSHTLVTLWA